MKPTHSFLPTAALACLAAASLFCRVPAARGAGPSPSPAAAADDPAHKAAAEEILKAMHMEALFDTTAERMMTALDRIADGAARQLGNKPEVADFQKRMHTETRDMLKQQFNWDLLKPEFVQSYADAFSTQELKELTAFYNSPLGQKLINKQPELSERMGKASQERARQVFPLIVKKVQDESAKLQATLATPSPSPAASAAPGTDVPAAKPTPAVAPAAKTTPKGD